MGQLALILGIGAFVAFAISIPISVNYFVDRRAHDGVDWFKRRGVRRNGQQAEASILSSTLLVERATGSKGSAAYSIVYEVRPAGAPPFRAKAIEVMYFSEARANGLEAGHAVHVRFDPADHTVVLVRRDVDETRRQREQDREAKEDALLRGP